MDGTLKILPGVLLFLPAFVIQRSVLRFQYYRNLAIGSLLLLSFACVIEAFGIIISTAGWWALLWIPVRLIGSFVLLLWASLSTIGVRWVICAGTIGAFGIVILEAGW